MIGTRILKIDSEMAEIIEVKVYNFNTDIIFCLCVITNCKYQNDGWQLWPQLSKPFLNRFSKFLCLSCSKFPEFSKTIPTFEIRMSRSQQNNQNKVNTHLLDTLYVVDMLDTVGDIIYLFMVLKVVFEDFPLSCNVIQKNTVYLYRLFSNRQE